MNNSNLNGEQSADFTLSKAEQAARKNNSNLNTNGGAPNNSNLKTAVSARAPFIAGLVAAALAVAKFAIGASSGSLSVLASAIDSLLDCLVSALNFFAIRKSASPANAKFNFGYGKIEALTALIEGIFIVAVGLGVAYSSASRLIWGGGESVNAPAAVFAMAISVVATGALVWFLRREYARRPNLVVKADALHYKSDLATNAAILVALAVVWASGFEAIDSALGLIVSAYIVWNACGLLKESIYMLLDGALPESTVARIVELIRNKPEIKSFHYLKTRKSGENNYFSAHFVFDPDTPLSRAHAVASEIEDAVRAEFGGKWIFDTHFDVDEQGEAV